MPDTTEAMASGGGGMLPDYPEDHNKITTTATVAAPDTSSLTTAMFNKTTWQVIKQTNRYGRVQVPNGLADGDKLRLMADPLGQEAVYFQQATSLSTGRNPLGLVLPPGAYGTLHWNATDSEWEWWGHGEAFWPVPPNAPADPVDLWDGATGGANGIAYASCYYDGGVILVTGGNSNANIIARAVPLDSDMQAGTPGNLVTFTPGNTIYRDRIFVQPLSQTIYAIWFQETTSGDINIVLMERSGSTLTMATSEVVMEAGVTVGWHTYYQLVPFQADWASATPRFWFLHGRSSPDTLHHMELDHCTVTGSGASLSLTVAAGQTPNTLVSIEKANNQSSMIEDPTDDGTWWIIGDSGDTNTTPHLIRFTESAGTISWGTRRLTRGDGTSGHVLSFEMKDGLKTMWLSVVANEVYVLEGGASGEPKLLGPGQTNGQISFTSNASSSRTGSTFEWGGLQFSITRLSTSNWSCARFRKDWYLPNAMRFHSDHENNAIWADIDIVQFLNGSLMLDSTLPSVPGVDVNIDPNTNDLSCALGPRPLQMHRKQVDNHFAMSFHHDATYDEAAFRMQVLEIPAWSRYKRGTLSR